MLFGCYTLLRYKPLVVVCIQAPEAYGPREVREAETAAAMKLLGLDWMQLNIDGDEPDWTWLHNLLRQLHRYHSGRVFAPYPEEGGQHQHNTVGEIAHTEFGSSVIYYTTYTTAGKSVGTARACVEPGWSILKEDALACYPSQRDDPRTAPHFTRPLDEYYVL